MPSLHAPRCSGPAGHVAALSPSLFVSLLPDCQEEDSKLKFLASICTLCGARLEGRYLPDGKLGAEKMVRGHPVGRGGGEG